MMLRIRRGDNPLLIWSLDVNAIHHDAAKPAETLHMEESKLADKDR
ncbi:unnamed protein product [Fusarium venenatum]|uniref:Uncharacterized protein n=1 Tax=Fusarium venenatum TaxID=56646 RepID=A0A2L2SP70_9HYPO|nr:uncharacterized protein FVRRES_12255 [Fusarium venenatum]CEI39564.1 unnamed protein product [Fusarium venenatum]